MARSRREGLDYVPDPPCTDGCKYRQQCANENAKLTCRAYRLYSVEKTWKPGDIAVAIAPEADGECNHCGKEIYQVFAFCGRRCHDLWWVSIEESEGVYVELENRKRGYTSEI